MLDLLLHLLFLGFLFVGFVLLLLSESCIKDLLLCFTLYDLQSFLDLFDIVDAFRLDNLALDDVVSKFNMLNKLVVSLLQQIYIVIYVKHNLRVNMMDASILFADVSLFVTVFLGLFLQNLSQFFESDYA